MLEAALDYATRAGWCVFPARPDAKCSYKSADHSDGRKWGLTRDPPEIRADFTRWPYARIGIPTGAVNGIVVIEADTIAGHGVDGLAALRQLEAEHGALPETPKAISPSGSDHRYFRHPGADIKIKNSASAIGRGIDVRGDGGMVIAPPSINPDGRAYCWIDKSPIAALPGWLIELTRDKPRLISERALAAIRRPFNGPSSYGNAALEAEIAALVNAAPGTRNDALNRAAFSLFQLVVGGELDGTEAMRRLLEATKVNGARDSTAQIKTTIRSGAHAGLQHPRRRPT